jgi:hypothetical protein
MMPARSFSGTRSSLAKRRARLLKGSRRFYGSLTSLGPQVHQRYGVSRTRQVAEVLYYQWRLGAGHSDYYMFQLYRRDLDDAARQRFLMQASWDALSPLLNQADRRSDDSKLALALHFAARGLPTPRMLGYTAAAPTPAQRNRPEFTPVSDLPRHIPPDGCVLKPDRSTWGVGVLVFNSFEKGVFEHVNGKRYDVNALEQALREQGGSFVVQERLHNHPELANLGLPSLATLRVLTYGSGESIRVARAAIKFPVGRHGVDNYHAGGIAAPVDLATGRIGEAVGSRGLEWLAVHPESGQRFEGLTVPLWQEVLAQTRRAAMSMPEYRCLGWDVAVTPEGVRIIEANSVWGTDIVQRPHRAGMWEGDFRRWCVETVADARLAPAVRRWLGI